MRYYALRIMSGEMVHTSLPLAAPRFSRKLKGGGSLRGHMDPAVNAELRTEKHDDGLPVLWPWATWILAEDNGGHLQWGGPLIHPVRQDSRYNIECGGIMAWLNRQYWLGGPYRKTRVDPLQVVRDLVANVQASPEANIGLVVDDTTSDLRIGEPAQGDRDARPVEFVEWETPKIGREINNLATSEPGFDYREEVRWLDRNAQTVEFRIRLGFPRLGTRRHELTFDTQWNLGPEGQIGDGDYYAQTVVGVGKGQGRDMVGPIVESVPTPLVPRVMAVADHKTVGREEQLRKLVRAETTARTVMSRIPRVPVRDTPHAPLGSWHVGDEVLARVRTDWGTADMWGRITEDEWRPDDAYPAVLTLEPATAFGA